MAKKRKKKSNILSGLIIVLCILMILPILSFVFKVNEPDTPVDDMPTEEVQLYYEVSFVVNECCYPVKSLFVKVGEKPILPDCDVKCSHVSYNEETGELTEQHIFVGWTYNGQFVSQAHCPAFNTNVVLVAQFETRSGPVELVDFPLEWLE